MLPKNKQTDKKKQALPQERLFFYFFQFIKYICLNPNLPQFRSNAI